MDLVFHLSGFHNPQFLSLLYSGTQYRISFLTTRNFPIQLLSLGLNQLSPHTLAKLACLIGDLSLGFRFSFIKTKSNKKDRY